MCGIAGIVDITGTGTPPARDALLRMAGALYHRGPDEFGLYRDERAGLAHARLSIIDLATGQQPLANSDETLWIVFNGEIFNYVELREELQARGYVFRTKSDTEVIVHAYQAWGDGAFARMNGQWAIALWDARRQRLVLSRDRLGVRPLYLCEHRGRLYFASEVKAIFAADASIPRELDPIGMDQTFTFWSIVPPQSVFRGIEELRPGVVRTFQDGRVSEHEYWHASYAVDSQWIPDSSAAAVGNDANDDVGTADAVGNDVAAVGNDAVQAVRQALEKATELRMVRADVPVGSYLSGGLDSSLVAALGRRYAGDRFQTFSLRFRDAEYDETAFQRLMAKRLNSQHHEVEVSRENIANAFSDVIYHAERPILRTAPAPLFLLSRLVRRHGIKVVLTGEGADEMFGGYDLFREGKVRRFWARQPQSKRRPRLLERLYPYLARSPVSQQAMARQFFGRNLDRWSAPGFAHDTRWHTTASLKRFFAPRLRDAVAPRDAVKEFLASLPQEFPLWSPLAQDQYIEARTLLSGYLLSSQGDRMLMAHSVEGRFPFLDKNVVALAGSLPPQWKLRVLDEKHVLKQAAKGLVADEIIARQKQPYRAPDALSFVGPTSPDYVEEMLAEAAVAEAGVFDPAAVTQLWKKCKARAEGQFSNADNMALVGILSTQLVHHHFVKKQPSVERSIRLTVDVDRLQRGSVARAGVTIQP